MARLDRQMQGGGHPVHQQMLKGSPSRSPRTDWCYPKLCEVHRKCRSRPERRSRHFGRLRKTHKVQQRGSDISEPPIMELRPWQVCLKDDWNRIRGMRRVRGAAYGIAHHFAVAMIGRDEDSTSTFDNGLKDPTKAGIYRLYGLDCSVEFARMPNHVRIGKVEHDEVKLS